jgi:hypothetical protein
VAAAVLLLTSCNNRDERMLTIINEDGTCSREMTFHPDQETVMAPVNEPIQSNGLHFGPDWERTWSTKGDSVRHACPMTQEQWDSLMSVWSEQEEPQTGLMHVKRQYQNVSEMSDSLTQAVRHLFKATASLDKHFKWFYTDYTYKETFAITNIEQIFSVPLDRFVSADTASYWFTGEPNLAAGLTGAEQKEMLDEIETRISQWFCACTMSNIYAHVWKNYDEVKNPPVSEEQFWALKDSVIMSPAVRDLNLFGNISQVSNILKDFYQSDAYTPLFSDSTRWERLLEIKYEDYERLVTMKPMLDYVMPGKVIDAGNGVVEGNVVRYRFSGERLIPHPYNVTITSRVTNVWAFIVTFLVILLAIGSFFYRKKR